MNEPDKAFFTLFGEEATAAQRRRILEVQEALGLRSSDSLWSVLLALGYFQQLYEAIPEKIQRSVKKAVEEFKSGVRIRTKEAHQRAIEDLNNSVQEFLPKVVAEVEGREKWKWATRLVIAVSGLVILLVLSHLLVGKFFFEHGFRSGSSVSSGLVAWASSPGGIRARYLDRQGLLDRVDWEGINWEFSFDGAQYYVLAKQGILKKIDDEHLKWLTSRSGKLALEIDGAGLLDASTREKLTWLNGSEGRAIYWWIRNGPNKNVSRFVAYVECVKGGTSRSCSSP